CARSLVRFFEKASEEIDPSIGFTDIEQGSEDFRYANIAVKCGFLSNFPDGSFKPSADVTTIEALGGLVSGLRFQDEMANLRALYSRAPTYAPQSVIANDLKLKYSDTLTKPLDYYPRGEMAFSLQQTDKLSDYRRAYIGNTFDWVHCQAPWVGKLRSTAMDAAFSKIGYPYVWGGESDLEGGYDCSGLVYYVLHGVLGYPMKRNSNDQAKDDRYPRVKREDLLAGDLVFFYKSGGRESQTIGHAGLYIGQNLFIHSTGGNAGVSVDSLSGYWEENFAWARRVIAELEPETFDTYVLLTNPTHSEVSAELTYMLSEGRKTGETLSIPPLARATVKVDRKLFNQEVSTSIKASDDILAERAMYFRYRGAYSGGSTSPGVPEPALVWYLAEGCTAWGFDTYILLGNPREEVAEANVSLMDSNGQTKNLSLTLPPTSRSTISVDSVPGFEQAEFSCRVDATSPIVVERSMYFAYGEVSGGHNSTAQKDLGTEWYLSEGYTGEGFDSYILLLNPQPQSANAKVQLFGNEGEKKEVLLYVPPMSRSTLVVDNVKGWESKEFSSRVESDVPIAVERSMYFTYHGISDGHAAVASRDLSSDWYFAEGYTTGRFDTYLLLFNPSDKKVNANVYFMLENGGLVERRFEIEPLSRRTIEVDRIESMEAVEFSTRISSDVPIVVERAMYFIYGAIDGGSCSPGVERPGRDWFFSEGYTGI
ncbi:MAG: NlpC/P60 family protein, partial [Actinomycetota bacterium]|nr:NlpC/P60 family protein [Actinomycetota bacterium]